MASAIGKLVRELAPAFDKLSRPTPAEDGEVDGFSGLSNRGSYERLLPSEWALAGAVPLEFLRRAANAEQAFYRLARREPAKKEGLLVLFDAGPDQLGACRIVQLALLVLLVERAEQRGEPLLWQLLHHLGEPAVASLNEQSVRRFLDARTALRSSPKAIESWRSSYKGLRLWLVAGPSHAGSLAGHATFVSLAERVARDARLVDVKLCPKGRAPIELALSIPEPAIAVRLVRDPFAVPRPPAVGLKAPGVASNLLLNDSGSRLFYRASGGGLVAIAVPNSPRGDPGRPRRYDVPSGSAVIGAGGRARKITWLSMARGLLSLRSTVPLHQNEVALTAGGPLLEVSETLWPIAYFPERMMAFVAPDHSLWRVDFASGRSRPIAEGVLAFSSAGPWPVAFVQRSVEPEIDGPGLLELRPYTASAPVKWDQEIGSAFLRRPNTLRDSWVFAYEAPRRVWHVQVREDDYALKSEVILRPPTGTTVVGVDAGSGLYLLDGERKELALVKRSSNQVVLKTSSPMVDVQVAASGPIVAYVTQSGELGALDLSGQTRLRRTLEAT
jgi:hypothetical protein